MLFAQRFHLHDKNWKLGWPELISIMKNYNLECQPFENSDNYVARLSTTDKSDAKRFFQLRHDHSRKIAWPLGNSAFSRANGDRQRFRAMVQKQYPMSIEIHSVAPGYKEFRKVI